MDTKESKEKDSFYQARKANDLYRVPLLKPLELVSGDEDSWFLRFNNFKENSKDIYVEKIEIIDSIVIGYAPSTYFNGKMTKIWYVINYKDKKINYYTNQMMYDQEVNRLDIVTELKKSIEFYENYWAEKNQTSQTD